MTSLSFVSIAKILFLTNLLTPGQLAFSIAEQCDPNPCGKNAECKVVSGVTACVCPHPTTGDAFVSCEPPEPENSRGALEAEAPVTSGAIGKKTSTPRPATTTFTKAPVQNIKSTTEKRKNQYGDFAASFVVESNYQKDTGTVGTSQKYSPQLHSVTPSTADMDLHNDRNVHRIPPVSSFKPIQFDSSLRKVFGEARHQGQSPIVSNAHGSGTKPFPANGYERVPDPYGKYQNCRRIRGIVVCADNAGERSESRLQNVDRVHINFNPGSPRNQNDHMPPTYDPFKFAQNVGYDRRPVHGTPIDHRFGSSSMASSHSNNNRFHDKYNMNFDSKTQTESSDLCSKFCGKNSVCKVFNGRPICGCPEDHTGDASVHCVPLHDFEGPNSGCEGHVDCRDNEICVKGHCSDPCKTFQPSNYDVNEHLRSSGFVTKSNAGQLCGTNAVCQVIQHTPLCSCGPGSSGNPYVACSDNHLA